MTDSSRNEITNLTINEHQLPTVEKAGNFKGIMLCNRPSKENEKQKVSAPTIKKRSKNKYDLITREQEKMVQEYAHDSLHSKGIAQENQKLVYRLEDIHKGTRLSVPRAPLGEFPKINKPQIKLPTTNPPMRKSVNLVPTSVPNKISIKEQIFL